MSRFRAACRVLIVAVLLLCGGLAASAQTPLLANGGFEKGLENWGQRSQTKSVYQILSPGYKSEKYARLQVGENDPLRDRQAVYFNRRDLPTAEGYYRLRFAARSALQKGGGGARVVNFDAATKVLTAFAPGAAGVPQVSGDTPWTEYSFIYQVPPKTALCVLQLDGNDIIGTLDFDAISIEKLDSSEGKKLLTEQRKPRFEIPPFQPVPPRTPQFPLKTKRMLASDAEIAMARANIEKYPPARAVLEAIQEKADPWLEWSDEELRRLLTSARVPRAFDLNVHGCPVHGDEVFEKGGAYPWILDPRHPLQVTCPVGGEKYPGNDYEAYANSDFREKKGWDGEYVDDGWGWVAPDGERYWFVAYANQWNWYRTIEPAILNLSRAYLLTGDQRYAHKAAVMLVRLAEVYPEMDYENQSRYGLMSKMQGNRYPGKVLNLIWETFFARDFAEAYDNVWSTLDGDLALQKLYGKSGPELRAFVEANLLEDAVDAYFKGQIRGNFGMHQNALLHVLLARQQMDMKKYFHLLVDEPGEDIPHTGLRYALYNQVWRDGTPFESPGYNWLWIQNFATLSRLLQKGGYDLFREPKMKLLFDSPLNIVNIGRYTPSLGDSGGVNGGLVGRNVPVYETAYDAYRDPRYLQWMKGTGEEDNRGFTTYDTLFHAPLPEKTATPDARVLPPQPSRLLAGYGVGILNNPADTVSLTLTYGMHVSHFHWDFLNFDLFANGQAMLPDLGYPDAMNAYVSSIYTWSKNTIAHNTVVVDAQMQDSNRPGVLHDLAVSPFARSIEASSPAYKDATEYRRHLIQVDAGEERSYVVDVFRVRGGHQHDYSLHGPPGEVQTIDGTWSAPAPGTLAGPKVELGEIYDAPALAGKEYSGSYGGYHGSGFQHLFHVQKLQNGRGALEYRHEKDSDARLRIHPLTPNAQEVFLADAYDLPRARKHIVKYLIARRQSADEAPLRSTFISVFEPYHKEPFLQAAEVLPLQSGDGVAVQVRRDGATDIILSDPQQTRKQLAAYDLETDARSAVLTFDAQRKLRRVFFSGGSFLKCGARTFNAVPLRGTVSAVDAMAQTVSCALPDGALPDGAPSGLDALAGRVAHFSNAQRETVHPVASATRAGNVLTIKTADALLVGRARVKSADGASVAIDTPLPFAPTYHGTTLLNAEFAPLAPVQSVETGAITLAQAPEKPLAAGDDIWFSDIAVGDQIEFPALFYLTAKEM